MKDKNYNKKSNKIKGIFTRETGMDNLTIPRYNVAGSFLSEDQALMYLAGALVEAHIKIRQQKHV